MTRRENKQTALTKQRKFYRWLSQLCWLVWQQKTVALTFILKSLFLRSEKAIPQEGGTRTKSRQICKLNFSFLGHCTTVIISQTDFSRSVLKIKCSCSANFLFLLTAYVPILQFTMRFLKELLAICIRIIRSKNQSIEWSIDRLHWLIAWLSSLLIYLLAV